MARAVCVSIKYAKFLSVMTKLHASNKYYIGNYLTILTKKSSRKERSLERTM